MRRKLILGAISLIIALSFVFVACDNDNIEKDWKENLPQMTTYSLVEGMSGHVANVPYDKYLSSEVDFEGKTVLDIKDFGASTDNSAKENQQAINNALVEAGKQNAVVKVEGGTYFTGTINMQSNATLYIAEGSSLKLPAYGDLTDAEKREIIFGALVRADGVDNWRITGPGKLDGNGTSYTKEPANPTRNVSQQTFKLKTKVLEYRARIRERINEEFGYHILFTNECDGVTIDNIIIYEPSQWTVKLQNTDNVKINNVVMDNNFYVANSDGFDIFGGENVTIENCFIATGDDGIVLKSPTSPIKNVTVRNCEIMSLANNFKIGTETGNDVTNVTVEDCYFFAFEIDSGYSGIAIESADGANISNITVRNIAMNNIPSTLLIWLGYRLDSNKGSDGTMGSVSNINIENIYAKNVDIASAVVGCEYEGQSYDVTDVLLKNIEIEYRDCAEELNIYKGNNVDHTNMGGYPEITRVSHTYFISHELSAYYDLPVYGLYAYHVNGLTLENFKVKERTANTRPFTNIGTFDSRDSIVNAVIK